MHAHLSVLTTDPATGIHRVQGSHAGSALPAGPHLGGAGSAPVRRPPVALAASPHSASRRTRRLPALDYQRQSGPHRLQVRSHAAACAGICVYGDTQLLQPLGCAQLCSILYAYLLLRRGCMHAASLNSSAVRCSPGQIRTLLLMAAIVWATVPACMPSVLLLLHCRSCLMRHVVCTYVSRHV